MRIADDKGTRRTNDKDFISPLLSLLSPNPPPTNWLTLSLLFPRLSLNSEATGVVVSEQSKWEKQWEEFTGNNQIVNSELKTRTCSDEPRLFFLKSLDS